MSADWSGPAQVVTRWATWTATLTSATNQTNVCKWRRVGQMAQISGKAQWTGAGGVGSLTLTIPSSSVSGWTAANVIDTAALPGGAGGTNQTNPYFSNCLWYDSGVGWVNLFVVFASTTTVNFAAGGALQDGSSMANGDALNFIFEVPIVGW